MTAENGRVPAPGKDSTEPADELQAEQALLERPSLSIRTRIIIGFVLLFLMMCGGTIAVVSLIVQQRDKTLFLEKMEEYTFEVQQARRFEKNFFLYGTNLRDALDNVQTAADHLAQSAADLRRVAGEEAVRSMQERLRLYQEQLEKLSHPGRDTAPAQDPAARAVEAALRKYGSQLITDAEAMIGRERLALHRIFQSSIFLALGFLSVMFLLMAVVAGLLIRAVLGPLARFERYTARIAAGDYTPIAPARRYRDEFSHLAVAINRMLRELELRQQQLIQSGKMAAIGTLTSGIAHELNNPLNNIGLTTEALMENFAEYTDQQKLAMLDQICAQVARASSTVRTLLDFTRKEKAVFTRVKIPAIIRDTVKLLANEMKLSGAVLHERMEDPIPEVIGNPRNLQQVFLNLMLNAIQAMPDGGDLTVSASVDGDFVRVDISDTGVGIPEEALNKIFDPFFTTKEPGTGTGLGLAVSYGIIEAHRGKILVQSVVGKGSTFSVLLPSADAARGEKPVG